MKKEELLEQCSKSFEDIIELIDAGFLAGFFELTIENAGNIETIRAICEERIKEINEVLKQ